MADDSKWQTQFSDIFGTKDRQKVACYRASKKILENYGVSGGANINPIQMVKQENGILKIKNVKEGKEYIDEQLSKENVVLVGVDDGRDKTYNSDKTTEHFIVIVGRGCDGGAIFYRYFEVGTSYKNKGININNKLYLNSDGTISGKTPSGTKTYTIAQVRRNN